MDDLTRLHLLAALKRDEGSSLRMYADDRGVPTIGYGHNLTARGISLAAAETILDDDLRATELDLAAALPWTADLSPARYGVVCNMAYNLGVPGLLEFKHFLAALHAKDYVSAVQEMRASEWARQVGPRATRLMQQMAEDVWA